MVLVLKNKDPDPYMGLDWIRIRTWKNIGSGSGSV